MVPMCMDDVNCSRELENTILEIIVIETGRVGFYVIKYFKLIAYANQSSSLVNVIGQKFEGQRFKSAHAH